MSMLMSRKLRAVDMELNAGEKEILERTRSCFVYYDAVFDVKVAWERTVQEYILEADIMDVDVAGEYSDVEKSEMKEPERKVTTPAKGKNQAGISPEEGGRKHKGQSSLKIKSPGSPKNIVDEFFQRRSGSGHGEKKDVKDKQAVVDLSEEPEVHHKRVKTMREKEMEVQHGGIKIKREGAGFVPAKVVVKGDDDMVGGEKDFGVEDKGVTGTQAEKGRGVDAEPIGSGLKANEEEERQRSLTRV
ncbi:hypothetical protein L1987_69332 [Smallanthus sonchifolius]|uniref:Uncharacterized protein n=1 Tax=Smallanthus sonchifolius TaxID=185202 RepID=A0ACB9B5W2_9ASTR|nr:hypothetical protein L1987_69332 [Smallanthus sonchifolius]